MYSGVTKWWINQIFKVCTYFFLLWRIVWKCYFSKVPSANCWHWAGSDFTVYGRVLSGYFLWFLSHNCNFGLFSLHKTLKWTKHSNSVVEEIQSQNRKSLKILCFFTRSWVDTDILMIKAYEVWVFQWQFHVIITSEQSIY